MISLTEPITISDFYFLDFNNAKRLNKYIGYHDKDNAYYLFLFVRNNYPFLPSICFDDDFQLWAKLDAFFKLDIQSIERQFSSLNPDEIYFRANDLIRKANDLLDDFSTILFTSIGQYNPRLYELMFAAVNDFRNLKDWHFTVQQLMIPFVGMGYYIYLHWEAYTNEILRYINLSVRLKRSTIELENLARSTDIVTFKSYHEYTQTIQSLSQKRNKVRLFLSKV